jgi:hypothetical protein
MQPLAEMVGAIVNETLISLNLAQANDPRLHPLVRTVIADHAEDESLHHRYFSALFTVIWQQLGLEQRIAYGMLVPSFMRCFLDDDPSAAVPDLNLLGLSRSEIGDVLRSQALHTNAKLSAQEGARASVKFFRRCGLLDFSTIAHAFSTAGLVVEPAAS